MKNLIIFLITLFFSSSINAQVEEDFALHFGGGFAVGGISNIFFQKEVKLTKFESVLAGVGMSFLAGVAKEGIDENKKAGSFEWRDVGNTVLGGVAGSLSFHFLIDRVDRRNTPKAKQFRKAKKQTRRDKRKIQKSKL